MYLALLLWFYFTFTKSILVKLLVLVDVTVCNSVILITEMLENVCLARITRMWELAATICLMLEQQTAQGGASTFD